MKFGKYKGETLTKLLSDTKYCDWLKLQPWISNHQNIYNIIVSNQNIDTPTP